MSVLFESQNDLRVLHMKTDLCLKYLERPPQSNRESAPIVIFLHGRAANELDLFDLAPEVDPRFRVLCPRAPLEMGENAFGWFHTQYLADGPVHDPDEAEKSRLLLIRFIGEVQSKYQIKPSQLFLFGFSQGSIMSLGITLDQPEILGGVAALSGRILPEHLLKAPSNKLHGLPILLSHGLTDEVLSIDCARAAQKILSELPVLLSYFEYPMGHDVTEMNFTDVKKWLRERADFLQHGESAFSGEPHKRK